MAATVLPAPLLIIAIAALWSLKPNYEVGHEVKKLPESKLIGKDERNARTWEEYPHFANQLTTWRTSLRTTAKVKRSKAPTSLYSNSVSTFHQTIKLIHDVELNPGPQSSSDRGPGVRKDNKVKIAHLNVRSLKRREHLILVRKTVLENKFDVFTVSETWLDNSVSDLRNSKYRDMIYTESTDKTRKAAEYAYTCCKHTRPRYSGIFLIFRVMDFTSFGSNSK